MKKPSGLVAHTAFNQTDSEMERRKEEMDPVAKIFCGAGILLVGSLLGIVLIGWALLYIFFGTAQAILPDEKREYPGYIEVSKEPDDHIR